MLFQDQFPWGGDFGELVFCSGDGWVGSVIKRLLTEGYLAHRWGVEGNLFQNHPYKDAAPVSNDRFQSIAAGNTDGTVFTFTGQRIGPARSGRRVIVGTVQARSTNTTGVSMTIGGVSATLLKRQATNNGTAEIWMATVPTGTTASVVMTWSDAIGRCGITVWQVPSLNSDTPLDTDGGDTGNAANSADVTLTTQAGAHIFGIGLRVSPPGHAFWRNMTGRGDMLLEEVDSSNMTAADATAAGSSLTVGLDNNGAGAITESPFAVVALK